MIVLKKCFDMIGKRGISCGSNFRFSAYGKKIPNESGNLPKDPSDY